jgi:hypothetical protein
MTPKEKAKELVDKFDGVGLQQRNEAIACALICVDEILNINSVDKDFELSDYWIEVKEEAGTSAEAGGIYCHGCYSL